MGKFEIRSWGDGGLDNRNAPNDGYAKDKGGSIGVERDELHSGGNKHAASKVNAHPNAEQKRKGRA